MFCSPQLHQLCYCASFLFFVLTFILFSPLPSPASVSLMRMEIFNLGVSVKFLPEQEKPGHRTCDASVNSGKS